MNSTSSWAIEADYLQACNCDFGCPCEFSAPPTKGYCDGLGAWRVIRGNRADVKLDGLAFAFVAHWPKQLHEGNGTCAMFFDDRADPAQRAALLQICSGKEGGPFEILNTTFSQILPARFASFKFEIDGHNCSLQIQDAVEVALEPIKNPVTGQPESVRLEHSTGFMFKQAAALDATKLKVNTGELEFNWPNKAGFLCRVQYANA